MAAEAPVDTLDPELLEAFLRDLSDHRFEAEDESRRRWLGPLPEVLHTFTEARVMRLVLRDGWPYQPPQLDVEGIESWHADHDRLCLWQQGDDTRTWTTVEGILRRIDEWVEDARGGFAKQGGALDPHLYFAPASGIVIGIDVDELVGGAFQDGQHGFLHVDSRGALISGRRSASDPDAIEGRWYYRDGVSSPPRNLDAFEAALTENQRTRYSTFQRAHGRGFHVLIWSTPHGHAPLILVVEDQPPHGRVAQACAPTPISVADRLRRAGPDAQVLRSKRAVIFGIGAIGSHLCDLLARSGIGHLTLIDGDTIYPVGQVRHAAAAEYAFTPKPSAMKISLRHFDWTDLHADNRSTWASGDLMARIDGFDLAVDATGLAPFSELLSRVAEAKNVPLISVALYRGGALARIRRQAERDVPLAQRRGHWRYPTIPPGEESEEYIGVEAGCVAPIHNAPPAAVVHAAVVAAHASIDVLTGRLTLPDEHIEVITPIEPPFHHRGRATTVPPALQMTDEAAAMIRSAARAAIPNETGGILAGIHDHAGMPVVVSAVEIPSRDPSPAGYEIDALATSAALDHARQSDHRLGYLGEWHSHPSDQGASPKDRKTMRSLAAHPDTGTPCLVVARPTASRFELDAYLADPDGLVPLQIVAVGPLAQDEANE